MNGDILKNIKCRKVFTARCTLCADPANYFCALALYCAKTQQLCLQMQFNSFVVMSFNIKRRQYRSKTCQNSLLGSYTKVCHAVINLLLVIFFLPFYSLKLNFLHPLQCQLWLLHSTTSSPLECREDHLHITHYQFHQKPASETLMQISKKWTVVT